MILHLILIDSKTKDVWKTPKHSENRKKDDFHTEVKPTIKSDLPQKLKDSFGKNCNIEIIDGEFI